MPEIDTDDFSTRLRNRAIRLSTAELLISRIEGSAQEEDLTEAPNCGGYGRIRHFHQAAVPPWPANPLPIEPASRHLAIEPQTIMNAQVFQNAACNWRCWYCFVPFDLLSANERRSGWLTSGQMVDLYLAEDSRPLIIDCSGGQPDLVPEWIPWMMQALIDRGVDRSVYLWSDDNLSNDYFWRYTSTADQQLVAEYSMYGRVCCFKGFDSRSFAFNTRAESKLFDRQFGLFERLFNLGIDLYAYATFTSSDDSNIGGKMCEFIDRLQMIHPNLPLRLVPLRIEAFGVVEPRVRSEHRRAMEIQVEAVETWTTELGHRFDSVLLGLPISQVPLGR